MKVRLLARDSKMTNIAIMKCSTYWKRQGADVGWYDPMFDTDCDILYDSQLFDFTEPYPYYPSCEVYKGGTGVDVSLKLPKEIDNILELDYSLYPNCEYSMQFYSRGCIRNCPFCLVREKEGYIHSTTPMKLNPNGRHIEVLDNNFFASPKWREAVADILRIGQPVNLHGVDIRIMDEEQAEALNSMKMCGQIHIAWDMPNTNILPKIKSMLKFIKPYKLMCYVLIGYNTTPEYDLYRVNELKNIGVDPFVMAYNKADPYQNSFARWVNMKAIFKSVSWDEYKRA